MKKNLETVFVCSNCGNEFLKWAGQCSACHEWNSLREIKGVMKKKVMVGRGGTEVKNLGTIEGKREVEKNIVSTEMKEFNRVLGKGIVS